MRKDAQLAREVVFAIPREMTQAQGVELARGFVQREFVDRGMVADLNVHWDIGPDGMPKPHAHVMLSMREVNERGFGNKVREWNRTELVKDWREHWADHVNERLAALNIEGARRPSQLRSEGHRARAAAQDRRGERTTTGARRGLRRGGGPPAHRAGERRQDHRRSQGRTRRDNP